MLAFNHDSFMTSYKWRSPGTVDLLGMGNSWRGARFRDGGAEAIARERVERSGEEWGLFTFLKNHVPMSPCPHVPMISIPLHPSFRSHSLKINAHFVVGIYTNLHAAHGSGWNARRFVSIATM